MQYPLLNNYVPHLFLMKENNLEQNEYVKAIFTNFILFLTLVVHE